MAWISCTEREFDESPRVQMIDGIFHRWVDDEGPWVLVQWDPDYDEYRGGIDEVGNYRSRANAEQVAAEHNAKIVARVNAETTAKHEKEMARWRAFKRDTMPAAPKLLESLDDIPEPEYKNARHGGRYSLPFMEVRPMEFED